MSPVMFLKIESDGREFRLSGNVRSHQHAMRLLWIAMGRFLDEVEKQAPAKAPSDNESEEYLEIMRAAAEKCSSWSSEHAQLVKVLVTTLMVNGVLDDTPEDARRDLLGIVLAVAKAETAEEAERAAPVKDVLTALLLVTRRKQARGRIAMAKGGDAVTPQQVLSELLQLRQEWRTRLKELGFEMDSDAEGQEE